MIPQRPDWDPIEVTVIGKPATKGSVRAFVPRRKDGSMVTRKDGSPMVVKNDDSGDTGKQYAQTLAGEVAAALEARGMTLLTGGVWLEAVFVRPRPASHYGTGRNRDVLKDSAPLHPDNRPDVDKHLRAVLDALKGVAWRDDGQIIAAPCFKAFGEPARTILRIWELPATVGDRRALDQQQLSSSLMATQSM